MRFFSDSPRANPYVVRTNSRGDFPAPFSQDVFELEPPQGFSMLANAYLDFSRGTFFPEKLVSGLTVSLALGCHFPSATLVGYVGIELTWHLAHLQRDSHRILQTCIVCY